MNKNILLPAILLLTFISSQAFGQQDICRSIAEDIRGAASHLARIDAPTIRTLRNEMEYCGENWDICKRIDDPTYDATRRLTATMQKIVDIDQSGNNCRLCGDNLMQDIVSLARQVDSFNGLLSERHWSRAPSLLPNNWNNIANYPPCSTNRTTRHGGPIGTPNLIGNHKLALTCTSGCSGVWRHTMTVTSMDKQGNFSGTGYYDVDRGYTWSVQGKILGNTVNFKIVYTGKNQGYTSTNSGNIHPDGTMNGTGFSSTGQKHTWTSQ